MDFLRLIEHKKQGMALTAEEIRHFAFGAADGSIPDYQLAVLLMAIRLMGMNDREITDLTLAMASSGHELHPDVGGVPVDKHSTGGVGDTTTLILAPLVAACGGKVLKMSGRGLGHTGGTIDKMESIPGMKVVLPEDRFVEQVRRIGCAVVGQSAQLAPADGRLYALRDVTATVDSIPLIVSSILSKKFASGARAIVLDVKAGSGALMPTIEKSLELARTMVRIGNMAGRRVVAVISGMDEPLGSYVGNALEVKEAIDVLSGRYTREHPLTRVALYLGAQMLVASGVESDLKTAYEKEWAAIENGSGLKKLEEMILAQGGDPRVCSDTGLLPGAKVIRDVLCPEDGVLGRVDCTALGYIAQRMGAGRVRKEDKIDLGVGFVMHKRIGDVCRRGEVLCTLYASGEDSAARAEAELLGALVFGQDDVKRPDLISYVIDKDGTRPLMGGDWF